MVPKDKATSPKAIKVFFLSFVTSKFSFKVTQPGFFNLMTTGSIFNLKGFLAYLDFFKIGVENSKNTIILELKTPFYLTEFQR